MPTTTPTDETLVRQAQSGDTRAFEALIERHAGLVYSIARAWLRDHESAEDLVQEAFLRVHLSLGQLRDPARLPSWLGRLTRNLAINWTRRGQRRSQLVPMVPLEEAAHDVPDTTVKGAREIMESNERSQALTAAIDRLAPEQREVVMLHFGEGMPQRAIADRLGVHPMKVNRLLKRGLATLRELVGPAIDEAPPALEVPRTVVVKTTAVIAAASAMSSAAKASLAATAAATATVSTAELAKAGSVGLVHSIAAKIAAGGATMGMTKVTLGAAAVVAVGVFGYTQMKASGPSSAVQPVEGQGRSAASAVVLRDDPVLISLSHRAGTRWDATGEVRLNIDIQTLGTPDPVPPQSVEIRMTGEAESHVLAVADNGFARVEETNRDFRVTRSTLNGEPMEPEDLNGMNLEETLSDARTVFTIDPSGAIVGLELHDYGTPPEDRIFHELSHRLQCGLPAHPVQPGDTWTTEIELPSAPPGTLISVNCRLERVEDRDGQLVAVITREADVDVAGTFDLPNGWDLPEGAQATFTGLSGRLWSVEHRLVESGHTLYIRLARELDMPVHLQILTPAGPREVHHQVHQRMEFEFDYTLPS